VEIFFVFLVACFAGGAQSTFAQPSQKMVRTFQMHVSPDEDVWYISPPATLARQVITRLGRQLRWAHLDCSHLVHDIYAHAGFPYDYATSRDLYDGVEAFRRVYNPLPGDLVVWRGHVGIVIDPDEHKFLSELRTGVKVSQYDSRYWQRRGHPRFYRYALDGDGIPDWSQVATSPSQSTPDSSE
jgi:hypothetical protein